MASISQVGIELLVTGEKEATSALNRYANASDQLTRSVLNAAGKIQGTQNAWSRANDLYEKGILNAGGLRAAQTQLARELAVVNNYLKANGALNTQKALAELRAAQASQEAAQAARAAARAAEAQAREIEQVDSANRKVAQSFGEAVRAANTYQAANKSAEVSAEVFTRELAKQEQQAMDTARAHQQSLLALQQTALANKSAADSVAVYEREIDRLRTKFNPLYAASKRYETALEELKRAQQLGAITSQQYETALERLNTELATGTTAATAASARGLNRMGLVMQQTGYQVGDFLVQVQSGTNAFVAFGQQATQMAGLLTLSMNPKLVALGAVLSIAIPLTTAIAAGFMRTSDSMSGAATEAKELEDRLKSLDSSLKDWLRTVRAAETGVSLDELLGREGVDAAEARLQRAQQAMEAARAALSASSSGLGVIGGMTGFSLGADLRAQKDLNAATKEYEDALARLATLRRKESAERMQSVAEERLALKEQIALTRAGLTYGRDSIQYKQLEVEQTLRAYEADLRRQNIGEATIASLVEQYRQALELANQLKASEDSASGLANALREAASAMSALTGFSSSLDRALAVSAAKVQALRTGADAAVAGQIAGMRLDLETRMNAAVAAGVDRGIVERTFGGERGRINQLAASEEERKRLEEANRSDGGGRSKETIDDYLAKLEREAALKRRVATLSEDVQRVEERRFSILEALKTKQGEVTDATRARVDALIAEEEAALKAAEAQKRREATIASFTSSFEQGIYGMVTNVEDAFRNMLTNILAEIYKQEVVSPLSQGLGDLLGGFLRNANGNAFDGGKVVPFARGGVVNTPTMFPMRNGTGLMGEAGPEAVMPLKRMRGGKLGVVAEQRSEPQEVAVRVYVDDNGNLDAKVEQVSARVVRSAAPGIVQNAVGAVVKQVQRGGSVKDAFK